jgi:glycosyltransferase involved in cell wall biosynthesis
MTICSPVIFVGPLPPPLHGFSEINRRMLDAIEAQGGAIRFDLAPHGSPWQTTPALIRILVGFVGALFFRRPCALYLALSGGSRQIVDALFLYLARLRGLRIFVHHHSFAYLNERSWMAALCLRAGSRATHIVLCETMGERLRARYGIPRENQRLVSNAAFLVPGESPAASATPGALLRLGYISAITVEKGIFTFLEAVAAAKAAGLDVEADIAGPLDPAIERVFRERLSGLGGVHYCGPVYERAKTEFFGRLDVLLFPSRYRNEAEPVVILEALRQGVPVIAFARGCIGCMLPHQAGLIVPEAEPFAPRATEQLKLYASDRDALSRSKAAARTAFLEHRSRSAAGLSALLEEICR